MNFLSLLKTNNFTKFALAGNPFRCDDCEFQALWWKSYKRIADVKSVTCISGGGERPTLIHSFHDLVKDAICKEGSISIETQFLIILLGVAIPLIIIILICASKHQRLRDSTVKSTAESVGKHRERAYTPTRSKVADMDSSKF